MGGDLISKLPDEMLIIILSSNLTLKEAARTSILSKRWKTLWTYYYGFFDFDDDSELCLRRPLFIFFDYNEYVKCSREYIDRVNKVLNSHQGFGVPINKLRICWKLSNGSKTVIDSWIDFVMKNKVQHFELEVSLIDTNRTRYNLTLATLIGTTRIGFPNLSVLRLSGVVLTNEALAYLLSPNNCPSLQHLSVIRAKSLKHVKVAGNLRLKSLEIALCTIDVIEIRSAVNLVSFGFNGGTYTKITYENVPLLTEASFGGPYVKNAVRIPIAPQLLSVMSQLVILKLDMTDDDMYIIASMFPKLNRVERLEVKAYTPRDGYLNICVMVMIYGCPRLQNFSLKMIYNGDKDPDIDSDSDSDSDGPLTEFGQQHEYLQAVEYKGWDGTEHDLKLITELFNISVLLDKVTIDPRTQFRSKEKEVQVTFYEEGFLIHDKKREESARKAAEKLRTILPQKVSMVLL